MTCVNEEFENFYCMKCKEPVIGEHSETGEMETYCEFCGNIVAEPGYYADIFAMDIGER